VQEVICLSVAWTFLGMQRLIVFVAALCVSTKVCVALPECPHGIWDGFCHEWELKDEGVACVHDTSPSAPIAKPTDVQCVPKSNGGIQYKCPSWVPHMCQPVYSGWFENVAEVSSNFADLSTLSTALAAAKLTSTLSGKGPFTLFAPSNEAFAKLDKALLAALLDPKNIDKLTEVLTYHVAVSIVKSTDLTDAEQIKTVEGEKVTVSITNGNIDINNARVIIPDITATNGVVHIIDAVLIPPGFAPPSDKNIVELAAATADLSTLVDALKAANLTAALSTKGPFTVFAPTNEAFAKLDKALLAKLLEPDNVATLTDLLTYHVVAAELTSSELKNDRSIETLEGMMVKVMADGSHIKINDAQVIIPNITATNGIVQVIDAVLIPPGFAPPPSHAIDQVTLV
jgi:transforming growth factor-beta-induced protein